MQFEFTGKNLDEAFDKALGRNSDYKYSKSICKKNWGNLDFIRHFYLGGGRTVTLSEIGLLDEVREAANELSIDRFGGFKDQIREKVKQVKEGAVELTFRRGYHFDHVRLAMGGGTLEGSFWVAVP